MANSMSTDKNALFKTAFENSNLYQIDHLLKEGADFTAPYLNGESFLTYAVKTERWEIVKMFAQYPTDTKDTAKFGAALLWAVYDTKSAMKHDEIKTEVMLLLIKSLRNANADLLHFTSKEDHYNAMQYAIKNRRISIVKELLEVGADPNRYIKQTSSPIQMAILYKDYPLITLLLSYGAEVSGNELFKLVQCNDWDTVSIVNKHNEDQLILKNFNALSEDFKMPLLNEAEELGLIDPISLDIICIPVRAADNNLYDKKYILQWLQNKNTSPLTNMLLPKKNLMFDDDVYQILTQFVKYKIKPEIDKRAQLIKKKKESECCLEEFEILKMQNSIVTRKQELEQKIFSQIESENKKIEFNNFKKTYNEVYHASLVKNPFSFMRHKIKNNDIDMDGVKRYSEKYPDSRTHRVLKIMSMRKS